MSFQKPLGAGARGVVTVLGAVAVPRQTDTYIIAGNYKQELSDATEVVAVRIDKHTSLLSNDWTPLPLVVALEVGEGKSIVVEGDKSKRNVIQARSVSISHGAVQEAGSQTR